MDDTNADTIGGSILHSNNIGNGNCVVKMTTPDKLRSQSVKNHVNLPSVSKQGVASEMDDTNADTIAGSSLQSNNIGNGNCVVEMTTPEKLRSQSVKNHVNLPSVSKQRVAAEMDDTNADTIAGSILQSNNIGNGNCVVEMTTPEKLRSQSVKNHFTLPSVSKQVLQGVKSACEGVLSYALGYKMTATKPNIVEFDKNSIDYTYSQADCNNMEEKLSDLKCVPTVETPLPGTSGVSEVNKSDHLFNDDAPHKQESSQETAYITSCGSSLNLPEENPFCAVMYDIIQLPVLCEINFVSIPNDVLETHLWMRHKIIKKGAKNRKIHIKWDDGEEFEIEELTLLHTTTDGTNYYLVKWEGWSSEYNTWEPIDNVAHCKELLDSFMHSWNMLPLGKKLDKQKAAKQLYKEYFNRRSRSNKKLNKVKKALIGNGTVKIRGSKQVNKRFNVNDKEYCDTRKAQLKALNEWQNELNERSSDPGKISVENDVDLDGPPTDFTYINDYVAGPGIEIPCDRRVACACTDCYRQRDMCCPSAVAGDFGYSKLGKVVLQPNSFIIECCDKCSCTPASCSNRVVQNGRKVDLTIFKTKNKGWGVKTKCRIPKGTFICVYNGEVLSHEEAEQRGKIYDPVGRTYLLDLEFCNQFTSQVPYTVDAANYGNLSHFLNHCCEPNLSIYGVFTKTIHLAFPRMAMFANREIKTGEELTFDYHMTGDSSPMSTSILNTSSSGREVAAASDGNTEMYLFTKDIFDFPEKEEKLVHHSTPNPPTKTYAQDDVNIANNQISPLYSNIREQNIENDMKCWSVGRKRTQNDTDFGSPRQQQKRLRLFKPDTDYINSPRVSTNAHASTSCDSSDIQLVVDDNSDDSGKFYNRSTATPTTPRVKEREPGYDNKQNDVLSMAETQVSTPKAKEKSPSGVNNISSVKTANHFRMACHCGATRCRKWLW